MKQKEQQSYIIAFERLVDRLADTIQALHKEQGIKCELPPGKLAVTMALECFLEAYELSPKERRERIKRIENATKAYFG